MANELLTLARSVLDKNTTEKRDSAWDNRGTGTGSLSHRSHGPGTAKSTPDHCDKAFVPLSHALGTRTAGQRGAERDSAWDNRGTVAIFDHGIIAKSQVPGGHRKPPLATDRPRRRYLSGQMGTKQAHARLRWTSRDLFGLHAVPERPAHTYSRLSRYDATGLIWLLSSWIRSSPGQIALTESEAAIECSTSILVYRKHRKPALGPLGDSLDDLGAGS